MAENSAIQWCDHTHNEWLGCMKVSEGCRFCYAEAMMDKRYHRVEWGQMKTATTEPSVGTRVLTSPANRRKPLSWNKKAAAFQDEHGRRQRVFCSSLSDVFDNQVPVNWRIDLLDLIFSTSSLDYLLLTKRPENIVKQLNEALEIVNGGYSPTERDNRHSSSSRRRTRDRQEGQNLAHQKAHLQSMDQNDSNDPLQTSSSGESDEARLSPNQDYERRTPLLRGSVPGGVPSLQWPDPTGDNGQPRRRNQEPQHSKQPAPSNLFRTADSRDPKTGSETLGLSRGQPPKKSGDNRDSDRDATTQDQRGANQNDRGSVWNEAKGSFGDMPRNNLAARLTAWLSGDPPPNVWLGTTCENQEMFDRRWPILQKIPAKVRFISYEPAIGPLHIYSGEGVMPDWIICGGESGSGYREMDPRWANDVRNDCNRAGIPFFFKQMAGKKPIPPELMIRQFPT